jgi:hypothetical protein
MTCGAARPRMTPRSLAQPTPFVAPRRRKLATVRTESAERHQRGKKPVTASDRAGMAAQLAAIIFPNMSDLPWLARMQT